MPSGNYQQEPGRALETEDTVDRQRHVAVKRGWW